MNKILFDDIFIWSNEYIICNRFNHKFKSNGNVNEIFKKIKEYIKKSGYEGYILVINKNMYTHVNIIDFLNDLNILKEFQLLLLSINSEHRNKTFDKNYSIGAFVLNLNNVNIEDYDLINMSEKVTKIYSSKNMIFMHPNKYKQYYYLRIGKVVKKYKIFNPEFFKTNNFLKKININDSQSYDDNPFYFIEQIIVSKSLSKFEDRIIEKYNLKKYFSPDKPCLFFGLYNLNDITFLENHRGKKYILWGGTDADKTNQNHSMLIKIVKNIKIDGHFSISKNLYSRLKNLGFESNIIKFNLVDKKLFKPVKNYGNKIYIYNGTSIGREHVYGKEIYEEVIKRLPEYEFILSNKINKTYEEMPYVYSKCFIGLRLTKNDGNANTVQEMKEMNIPVIHNGDDSNSISWNNVDDIELIIRYKNIDLFNEKIKKYKKILFICSDFPSYGGAATNTIKLYNFYKSLGKNVQCVFYSDEENNLEFSNKDIFFVRKSNLYKKLLELNPHLIILRNFVNDLNILKHFSCPIYFLIPGIFEPHLDKYYHEITTKDEMDRYIHHGILKTINFCTKSFCASNHTKRILKDFYNIDVDILYFNYVSFYNKFIKDFSDFDERNYEYGLIVSNFDRKVKNIENIMNVLKLTNKKIILIGKNSYKYSGKNIRTIDLINNRFLEKHYKRIKYIVQDSYYESCSNVFVESRFCGCKTIKLKDIIIDKSIYISNNKKNNNSELLLYKPYKNFNINLFSSLNNKKMINFNNNNSIKKANDFINNIMRKIRLTLKNKIKKYGETFKVLYFVNMDYFIRKMSRVRFHAIIKLIDIKNLELFFTGPGWYNYDDSLSLEENIDNMNTKFNFIIFYKPLDKINNVNKKTFKRIKIPICLRYNEMWDENWTKYELDNSNSSLIICHHYNDFLRYKEIYKYDLKKKFIYNPHHANPKIFYDKYKEREYDILLAGKSTKKHYPLRHRLQNLIFNNINDKLKKYKILQHNHPGYNNDYSYMDTALKEYAKNINKCYLCIGGTSKYNYRLGKYVEISMCGSLVLGDLPYEDKDRLKEFIIEVNMDMSDDEIINKIKKSLDNKELLKEKMIKAKIWASNFTTENYCNILYDSMIEYEKYYNENILI